MRGPRGEYDLIPGEPQPWSPGFDIPAPPGPRLPRVPVRPPPPGWENPFDPVAPVVPVPPTPPPPVLPPPPPLPPPPTIPTPSPPVRNLGAAFLPFGTATAVDGTSSVFGELLKKGAREKASGEFDKLLRKHVKSEFEKLLEQPIRSRIIRAGAKQAARGSRLLKRVPLLVGGAIVVGELFAGALSIYGRAKQEVEYELAEQRYREIAARRGAPRPPPPGDVGTHPTDQRMPAPKGKRRPKLPGLPIANGSTPQGGREIFNRNPAWDPVSPLENTRDPTTVATPTPGRGVGTSPAPLPTPAKKPVATTAAAAFFLPSLPLLSITKQRRLGPRPRVRAPGLTPVQPPAVSFPVTPAPPKLSTPRADSRLEVPASSLAGFVLPSAIDRAPPPDDGRGKCFVPKKGGRRGKCRQGYFNETAGGVEYTTWSTRRCPR